MKQGYTRPISHFKYSSLLLVSTSMAVGYPGVITFRYIWNKHVPKSGLLMELYRNLMIWHKIRKKTVSFLTEYHYCGVCASAFLCATGFNVMVVLWPTVVIYLRDITVFVVKYPCITYEKFRICDSKFGILMSCRFHRFDHRMRSICTRHILLTRLIMLLCIHRV